MKYGAHCYVFTDRWTDDQLDLLDTARDAGLDCFELACGDDVTFTPRLARRRAEALGLELMLSPGGIWPREYDLSAPVAEHRRQGLAWHQRQVDLAGELGATAYTGALYGHPGVLRYHLPTAGEQAIIAGGLRQLAEYGARQGVRIVIEPMSHFRTHVVNTAEQAVHLLELADHANLWMLLDTYHLVTETRDYAAQIRAAGGRLWGLHACESDRGVPGGGLVPWPAVFGALRETGFDGYLVFESYNSSIGDFAARRGMLHDVCPDGPAFVRTGLRFVKDGMAASISQQERASC